MSNKSTLFFVISLFAIPLFAGEIDDINAEINKIGAEMITLGGETRDLRESLDETFASGKFDTPEMKTIRKQIFAQRISLIKDTSTVSAKFKSIPEIAAKYAAVEKAADSTEARQILNEIKEDFDTGKFDTEEIALIKDNISATKKVIDEKTEVLRKMFDAQPQFTNQVAKINLAQKRLDELGTRRDNLLKKRQSLK